MEPMQIARQLPEGYVGLVLLNFTTHSLPPSSEALPLRVISLSLMRRYSKAWEPEAPDEFQNLQTPLMEV